MVSSPEVPDPDEEVVPGSNHTGALSFVDIQNKILAVIKTRDDSGGFTYSPKSDLVFDVRRRHECLALFRELVRGNRRFRTDRPVYLIAVTCRKNIEMDDTLRQGYEMISESSNQPLIGYWRSPTGDPYLDAVAARFCVKFDT